MSANNNIKLAAVKCKRKSVKKGKNAKKFCLSQKVVDFKNSKLSGASSIRLRWVLKGFKD